MHETLIMITSRDCQVNMQVFFHNTANFQHMMTYEFGCSCSEMQYSEITDQFSLLDSVFV